VIYKGFSSGQASRKGKLKNPLFTMKLRRQLEELGILRKGEIDFLKESPGRIFSREKLKLIR